MSPEIMVNTTSFEIGMFDPLFSDAHNPIHISINRKSNPVNYADTVNPIQSIEHDDSVSNIDIIIPNSKTAKPKLEPKHKENSVIFWTVMQLIN